MYEGVPITEPCTVSSGERAPDELSVTGAAESAFGSSSCLARPQSMISVSPNEPHRRMLQPRRDQRLALEASRVAAVAEQLLERHLATQPPIARGDDAPHSAARNLALDDVVLGAHRLQLVEVGRPGPLLHGHAIGRRRLHGLVGGAHLGIGPCRRNRHPPLRYQTPSA
jgi:hypothetical protein